MITQESQIQNREYYHKCVRTWNSLPVMGVCVYVPLLTVCVCVCVHYKVAQDSFYSTGNRTLTFSDSSY